MAHTIEQNRNYRRCVCKEWYYVYRKEKGDTVPVPSTLDLHLGPPSNST
jgi:hypothetical protein